MRMIAISLLAVLSMAGCASEAPDVFGERSELFPLAVGYLWTYDVQASHSGDAAFCVTGPGYASIPESASVDGRVALEWRGWCASQIPFRYLIPGAGDEVLGYDSQTDTWRTILPETLEDGLDLDEGAGHIALSYEGVVTVPAGTFTDCWSVTLGTLSRYQVYCRGVGPVQAADGTPGSGNPWSAELVSTNF